MCVLFVIRKTHLSTCSQTIKISFTVPELEDTLILIMEVANSMTLNVESLLIVLQNKTFCWIIALNISYIVLGKHV